MKKYFPILLSKAGEHKALKQLAQNVKNEICPVIEVLPEATNKLEALLIQDWVFEGNAVVLDFALSKPVKIAEIRRFLVSLLNNGVNIIPSIQENSEARYISLVRDLVNSHKIDVCIRISNDTGGFTDFSRNMSSQMALVNVRAANTILLLDLGYAGNHNFNNLATLAINTVSSLRNASEWKGIVIASGSFPENMTSLVPPGIVHRLKRYEWDIWNLVKANPSISRHIIYGDFGTKHPFYSDVSFRGSCTIKYTIEREFVIYRGELSSNHSDGNGQYITFAGRLIASRDYSGQNFSWGDGRIHVIGSYSLTDPKKKPGSAQTWVEISQNHHITLIHSIL